MEPEGPEADTACWKTLGKTRIQEPDNRLAEAAVAGFGPEAAFPPFSEIEPAAGSGPLGPLKATRYAYGLVVASETNVTSDTVLVQVAVSVKAVAESGTTAIWIACAPASSVWFVAATVNAIFVGSLASGTPRS
jgi:hypothetical protein